jgi:predicted PurR-regulated permease PerM
MIVISTWPLLIRLQARLRGKRGFATAVMTLVLLLVLVIPLGFSVAALVDNMDEIVGWVSSLDKVAVPPPPEWIAGLPLVGSKVTAAWQHLTAQGPGSLPALLAPYGGRFLQWFATQIGGIGAMILQFLITVLMCAILYVNGETVAWGMRKFACRLAGPHGDRAVLLAANSVRGVAMGVVVTAILQTLIAGTGLVIASVPAALLLCAAILICCLAQLPPILLMLPVVIWKFYTGPTLSACLLLGFVIVASTIDNFIRPILIRKGANLPLVLVFTGVIGGMISFGIMGIFIGPVILAVTYTLLKDWVEYRPEADGVMAPGIAVERALSAG